MTEHVVTEPALGFKLNMIGLDPNMIVLDINDIDVMPFCVHDAVLLRNVVNDILIMKGMLRFLCKPIMR